MRNFARLFLTLAVALIPLTSAWSADIVFRKSSSARVGNRLESQSKTEIVMAGLGNKKENVPANDVLRVEWDGEPAILKPARSAEAGGQLQKALADYQKALAEVDSGQTNLKTDLEFLIARVTAKLAKADPAKIDEAIEKLEAYTKVHSNTFRYYDAVMLLGETYMAKGDFVNADPAFKQLEQAPWEDYKMAAKIAEGRLLLKKDNFAQAQSLFQTVASQPAKTDAEKSRQYEARLGIATCFQRQNQFDKAAAQLDQVIKEAPPTDAKTMAEAYLRKGDNLLAAGQKKDALLAYLHVDVLFSGEKDLHAEALYHLASLWNEDAHPERAADARVKLTTDYPNSEWAKKLGG